MVLFRIIDLKSCQIENTQFRNNWTNFFVQFYLLALIVTTTSNTILPSNDMNILLPVPDTLAHYKTSLFVNYFDRSKKFHLNIHSQVLVKHCTNYISTITLTVSKTQFTIFISSDLMYPHGTIF